MYGTRNCNKMITMQDKSNIPNNEIDSVKNKKILQKIPLTEVTQTLRPRRGCKENVSVKICNENKIDVSKCGSKPLMPSKSEELLEKMGKVTKTCVLENSKKSILQSIQNLNLKKSNSSENTKKNSKILQKIPLTEATKTLRPRRGCVKSGDENICKENQLPQSKCSVKPRSIPKKRMHRSESIETLEELVNSRGNVMTIKENNKQSPLQSVDSNLNLENNKADIKVNSKPNLKRPLMSINQNEGSLAKKAKTNLVIGAQENSKVRRFPKWVSSGIESLKRGKKSARVSSVYDIEKDEDFMVEKSVSKKVVIKKAKITKIKNCSTKRIRKDKNLKSNWDKKLEYKKVTGKQTDNAFSKPCISVQKTKAVAAKQEQFKVTTCAAKTLQAEVIEPTKASSSSTELKTKGATDKISNITEVSSILSAANDVVKSFEVLETPEKHAKCTQVEFSQTNRGMQSSKNIQSFPMPQQSSTPENVDRPIIPAQVLCRDFDVTMLEIQRIAPHEDDAVFSDTEFLSPEKTALEAVEFSTLEGKAKSKKEKVENKLSCIKNLSASLSKSKDTEKTEMNYQRPKRACHQNKPVHNDSPDLESSFESELDDNEITLFESPAKKPKVDKEPQQRSPSKKVLKKLFPEEFNKTPVKVVEVEDQVLKPRLSYHSPAVFRRFISKTKKESKAVEKRKTKQDELIDSLNDHFSELENLELCIE